MEETSKKAVSAGEGPIPIKPPLFGCSGDSEPNPFMNLDDLFAGMYPRIFHLVSTGSDTSSSERSSVPICFF